MPSASRVMAMAAAGLLDEQAAGRLEALHVRDRPLGGDRGLLEVGRQHGRAGVAAVITPRRVDDNRRPLRLAPSRAAAMTSGQSTPLP